jgi:hypothetical protein
VLVLPVVQNFKRPHKKGQIQNDQNSTTYWSNPAKISKQQDYDVRKSSGKALGLVGKGGKWLFFSRFEKFNNFKSPTTTH